MCNIILESIHTCRSYSQDKFGQMYAGNDVSTSHQTVVVTTVSRIGRGHYKKNGGVGGGLTLYQTTNFRLFQIERVCRRQIQIRRKWQKVIQTGRKHCGKRRNCSLRAISPFLTVFSKGMFPWGVTMCHCVGMG